MFLDQTVPYFSFVRRHKTTANQESTNSLSSFLYSQCLPGSRDRTLVAVVSLILYQSFPRRDTKRIYGLAVGKPNCCDESRGEKCVSSRFIYVSTPGSGYSKGG